MNMMQNIILNSGIFTGQSNLFQNNNKPNNSNNSEVNLNIYLNDQKVINMKFSQDKKVEELIKKIKTDNKIDKFFKLLVNGKPLVNSLTLAENSLVDGAIIRISFLEDRNDEKTGYIKEIKMIFSAKEKY